MNKIIAVTNQKGGVGKTTTAINLAASLAKLGKSTLLIDIDPQANATSGLGLSKDREVSICEVIETPESIASAMVETEFSGLVILPARPDLAAMEVTLGTEDNRYFRLKEALGLVSFDYIIIDCPPALGLLTLNALSAANKILVPVQSEYFAMEGLGQLLQTIQQIRKGLNPQLELLGVVLTMLDRRNSLSGQVRSELKKHLGDKVMGVTIPRNVRLAEAPSFGKPISAYDKWSKGAKAYTKLAKIVARAA